MRSSPSQFPPHSLCLDPRWKQDVPEGPLKPVKHQGPVVEKGEGGLPPTHHSDTTSEGHT